MTADEQGSQHTLVGAVGVEKDVDLPRPPRYAGPRR